MRPGLAAHLAVALACAAVATRSAAATQVPGGTLAASETWTVAGSPYVIAGDLIVPTGVSLTLQPGVVVQFKASDAQGAGRDAARIELHVQGSLTAAGTAQGPITFQAESGSAAETWYGIVVGNTATAVVLTHVVVEAAVSGVYSLAPGTVLSVQDSTFRSSTTGLTLFAGTPTLTGLTVEGGQQGLSISGADTSPTIRRSVIRGATSYGAYVSPSGTATVTFDGCTVHGNGSAGIYATSGPTPVSLVVVNSLVTGNGRYGIEKEGTSIAVTATHTGAWGNGGAGATAYDFWGFTPGTGCLSVNPLYVDPAANLRLTSRSPARFAGDAGQDLGALPYVDDPTPTLVGTLWESFTAPQGTTEVTGDLTVPPGVTLTVPAGATLSFAASDLMRSGTSSVQAELIVRGTLDARGSASAPAAFRSAAGATADWFAIELASATEPSTLSRVAIDGADRALFVTSTAAHVVENVLVERSQYGLYARAGAVQVDALEVRSPTYAGVYLKAGASATVTNAVVSGAAWYGAYAEAVAGTTATVSLANSTFHGGANFGVFATSSATGAVNLTLHNSLVTGNGTTGLYRSGPGTFTVTNCDVWGNGTAYFNLTLGSGNIALDPVYANAPSDLRLRAGSPAIDSGGASGAPARDRLGVTRPLDGDGVGGAVVDMGAYEFVASPFCGDAQVGAGETCDEGALNGTYGHCAATCTSVLRCGDGAKNGPEECDDGNTSPGDGCSATCTVEVVPPAPSPPPSGGGGGCGTAGTGGGASLLAWLAPLALRRWRRRAQPRQDIDGNGT